MIGWYRVESPLGEGGMGTVYRATDTKLNRPVAIKLLSDDFADAAARRRFQREAQMASSLNHPHILTVYDAGEHEGRQYLVTEFVDGGTLKDWAKAEKRSWRQVVDLLAGVADGLAAAHAAGMTHRDIKPANILVAKNGYGKLADFGLAKLVEPADPNATRTLTEGATRTGVVVGTVTYMSPEQASGHVTDARSDIFSFGLVLYELLSGRRAFTGKTDLEVMQRIIHQPPEPLGEDLPASLRASIEKALEKDPADRYQSMRDVVVDLRRLTRQGEPSAPVGTAPKRQTRTWVTVAAAAVMAAALAAWRFWPSTAVEQIRSLAVLPLVNLSGDPNQEYVSDGATYALISGLGEISALKVISPTTVMRYKGTTKSLPEIGSELNVDAILAGSVHRVGDKVRITAQLIRAASDSLVWAQNYERDVKDMLRLESEVARAVADQIRVQIRSEESAHMASAGAVDPKAQEEFLLGSYSRWKPASADLAMAVEHFEKATRIDPGFAAAYAGLSGALAEQGQRQTAERAREAARKALELDPRLSEAHSALARMSMTYDWDWASAEQGFRRALELNPNSLEYCQCYSDLLAGLGRFSEAIAILENGLTTNPQSSAIHGSLGRILVWSHRYDEAIPRLNRALELDSQNAVAYLFLAEAYEVKADFPKALDATLQYLRLRRAEPDQSPLTGRIYAKMGRRADARRVLGNLTKPGANPNARDMAAFYFASGETERGFESLTRAFDERQDVLRVRVSGLWDGVRSDARFPELMARLNVP